MIGVQQHTEGWARLPWKQFERNLFRLQKRIYKATQRGDFKRAQGAPGNLQRLLLRSYSARCLAVRRVTQAGAHWARGKRTAGVDGIAKVTPALRLHMVDLLRNLRQPASPIRRVYIPKRNSSEMRPLGIPVMLDRALQALVKLAIEPGPGHPPASDGAMMPFSKMPAFNQLRTRLVITGIVESFVSNASWSMRSKHFSISREPSGCQDKLRFESDVIIDCLKRIVAASTRTEAIRVWLEFGFRGVLVSWNRQEAKPAGALEE